VSLEFLSPAESALARSPMEREARAAGARIERRDGWNVALRFDGEEPERRRCESTVGFADRSHLGKVELQAGAADLARLVAAGSGGEALELGRATRADGAWWCPYTPTRAVVLCEPADAATLRARLELAAAEFDGPASVLDVTTVFAALTVVGPLAGELFARFSAVDLRPAVMPVHGFRPVSVGRTPGTVLCEAEQRYLMLFGAALGSYMWTVVADAAESLGGGPVGLEALADA
jgi:glycine cleavage system aminomethyltransferase T